MPRRNHTESDYMQEYMLLYKRQGCLHLQPPRTFSSPEAFELFLRKYFTKTRMGGYGNVGVIEIKGIEPVKITQKVYRLESSIRRLLSSKTYNQPKDISAFLDAFLRQPPTNPPPDRTRKPRQSPDDLDDIHPVQPLFDSALAKDQD